MENEIVRDIEEMFKTIREINMKLNPKKCTFGIEEGMFLGYKVSTRVLKVCPDKVDAILSLPSVKCLKDMQKLNGKLASLNRLHSRKTRRGLSGYSDDRRRGAPRTMNFFTDESSGTGGSVAGLILTDLEGVEFTYALRFRFGAINNEAKYEALTVELNIAEKIGVKNLKANVDSRFKAFSIKQVPRSEKKDDALNKITSTSFSHLRPLQVNYVLREIHEGSYSMHAGTRSAMAKALRTGYYWPTMHKDARTLIRPCQDYQVHKPIPRNPQQKLTPITSPWPFYKYGIDIAGPFSKGPGKVKFLIVAIDYFKKWIEAKPVATITANQIKIFMWDNIVCRFRLPEEIISDNGKQFRDDPFKDWCEKLCIHQHFASVKLPQTNELVERANRSLGERIKARLDARSRNWIE
nr:reverse transcriptase domain-containing protein [Tanacetum cinerariifolium]